MDKSDINWILGIMLLFTSWQWYNIYQLNQSIKEESSKCLIKLDTTERLIDRMR
jgi:hypothetical protein